jgi:hypothetical protein
MGATLQKARARLVSIIGQFLLGMKEILAQLGFGFSFLSQSTSFFLRLDFFSLPFGK